MDSTRYSPVSSEFIKALKCLIEAKGSCNMCPYKSSVLGFCGDCKFYISRDDNVHYYCGVLEETRKTLSLGKNELNLAKNASVHLENMYKKMILEIMESE